MRNSLRPWDGRSVLSLSFKSVLCALANLVEELVCPESLSQRDYRSWRYNHGAVGPSLRQPRPLTYYQESTRRRAGLIWHADRGDR